MKKIAFDPTSARLFSIAIPIVVQNLVQYLQLQTDMAMLGHYNGLFLAAVGNVTFPYITMVNFLLGISTGATVMIAHSIGARQLTHAKRYAEVSFFYNSLISVPFFLILQFLATAIMTWLGTSPEVNASGAEYMKYLSYSLLFLGMEMSVSAILQGMGMTRHIMISGILKTCVNIVLDWSLIYGKFGMPELGIKGAALATSSANAIAAIYLVFALMMSKRMLFYPKLRGILKPKWSIQKKNIVIGFPSGLENIMWALAQIAIIRIVNEIDSLSAGLYLLVVRLQAVTFFIYLGLARGTMTLVGQKMGAGRFKDALHVGSLGLRYSFLFCFMASIFFLWIPDKILSIFTSDQTIILSAAPLLSIVAITIYPIAVNVVIGSAIRGMKDTQWMFYTQILGTCFTIGVSAVLVFVFKLGILGIFLTAFSDETIRSILNSLRFYKGRAFFRRLFARRQVYELS